MNRHRWFLLGVASVVVCFIGSVASAQDDQPGASEPPPEIPVIPDEPTTIDPAEFLPDDLAGRATVDFAGKTLADLIDWLREHQGLVVLLEGQALADAGVFPTDPVSDRLNDEPIYLLLNRLRSLGIAWYVDQDVVHVTSAAEAESRLTTTPFTIGDLLDAGYKADSLNSVIQNTVAPESWVAAGGEGEVSFLGDVMLVRQTRPRQREVQGLLAALRSPGRRTFISDPPQHAKLRERLEQEASLQVRDMPLDKAVATLAEATGIDIRLDQKALRDAGVRDRAPVTLSLEDRKLKTILQAMLLDVDLTWILRDGVLWITSKEADDFIKTAIYDVRDLARNDAEQAALESAIKSQTDPVWIDAGGPAGIESAKPGTMVVYATEQVLDQVLHLLETYREALRGSKPRLPEGEAPGGVVTVYYRMPSAMAKDLKELLPVLVRPETWKSFNQPDVPGEIYLAASAPENVSKEKGGEPLPEAYRARSVLIIRQTSDVHGEIREVIRRTETGDALTLGMGVGGMGAMGMGGFGGGYFSTPYGPAPQPSGVQVPQGTGYQR